MHNRPPLRLASTIGPIETGRLTALEDACSRRTALPIEHEARGTGAALDRAKRGGIDRASYTTADFGRAEHRVPPYLRRDQIPATAG